MVILMVMGCIKLVLRPLLVQSSSRRRGRDVPVICKIPRGSHWSANLYSRNSYAVPDAHYTCSALRCRPEAPRQRHGAVQVASFTRWWTASSCISRVLDVDHYVVATFCRRDCVPPGHPQPSQGSSPLHSDCLNCRGVSENVHICRQGLSAGEGYLATSWLARTESAGFWTWLLRFAPICSD